LTPSTSTKFQTAPLELLRSGDVLALRVPSTGRVIGFHGHEMQVAELAPEVWSALFKSQNSFALTIDEREALNEISVWKHGERAKAVNENPPASKTETAQKTSAITTAGSARAMSVRSLTINIAQICNLACTYCAAGGDGTYGSKVKSPEVDRTREQLAMLLSHVPNGDRFVITFLGGEPLLYPDLIMTIVRDARLLVAGRDIRLRFDIVTNGTLITASIAEMLASIRANVTISIDGAPEDNDGARVTKSGAGSSAMVLAGLTELIKVKPRLGSLTAGSVFGTHNLNVVRAWEFLAAFPFDFIKFDFAAESGDQIASRIFAHQVVEVAERAYARGGEAELRRLHTFNHLFQTLDDQARVENHCLAGKGHLQLDTDGKFTACQWFVGQNDELLGEGLTLDLSGENKRLRNFNEPLIEKNGCGSCWARHICGGGCMHVNKVKTGNKHQVDQAYCERTRTIIAKGIERYAEARYQKDDESVVETDGVRHGAVCEIY
jgi:uncharacterized protein